MLIERSIRAVTSPNAQRNFRRSARGIEWTLLVLLIAILGGLLAYLRVVERDSVDTYERSRLAAQARTVAETLEQQLVAISNALSALSAELGGSVATDAARSMSPKLQFLTDIMPGVRSIIVADARGRVTAANRSQFLGYDVGDRDYFRTPRASSDAELLYVSTPYTTLRGAYSINATRALVDHDGHFAGIVTATLDPEYFNVIVRSVLYAPDMRAALVHGDGVVFLEEPGTGANLGRDLKDGDSPFMRHVTSGAVDTVETRFATAESPARMTAHYSLQPSKLLMDKPIVVALDRSLALIRATWLRQTTLYALVLALGATVACAAVTAMQRHRSAAEAQRAARDRERRQRELERNEQLSSRLRQTEAGLHESEQRLGLVAEAANLGLWIRDIARDEVWGSDRWRALFGFDPDQVLTMPLIMDRVHPEDRAAVQRTFDDALKHAEQYEIEYRIERPGAGVRWIASRGRVDVDADGNPALIRGVSLDISARKATQEELEHQRREVTHLSRVSMLGGLSGALAHELNQPLTAILSNARAAQRFLAHEPVNLDELHAALRDIVDEDKRAGEVIRRLRLLLDAGESQRQVFDVNDAVIDVLKLLRGDLAENGVAVATDLARDLAPVNADRVQVQQVLINLVLNATDAMGSTARSERRLQVCTRWSTPASACISVRDTGSGVDAALTERIFESFFTTKPGGMGLGLSVCRTIIAAHGGTLWAENNPSGGAAFHFTIPLQGNVT